MKIFATILAVVIFGAAQAAQAKDAKTVDLTDPQAQASYAVGWSLGQMMKRDAVTVDPALLAKGIGDAIAGGKPALSDVQLHAALDQFQAKVDARRAELATQLADASKSQNVDFLKANAAKAGVVTLPSGLQYQILTTGTGAKPKDMDTITCNYRGMLIDGTEFDSSYKRGQPASFQVDMVIKGFTEALELMPAGSKWRIFIPSNLAYGEAGDGNQIPPNATLIFEVELLATHA